MAARTYFELASIIEKRAADKANALIHDEFRTREPIRAHAEDLAAIKLMFDIAVHLRNVPKGG